MAQEHLDPAVYGDYAQELTVSIAGAHIQWKGIPAAEKERVLPLIRQQSAALSAGYDVALKGGGPRQDWVYLDVAFREPPTPAQVRSLKGEVFAILLVTSWGGP